MIPAITPPTDNLYKFICLFGLTLFLFFSYNISFVHDRLAKNHLLVENIKTAAQHRLLSYKVIQGKNKNNRIRSTIKHSVEIDDLRIQLQKLESLMENSQADHKEIIALSGELNKLDIAIHSLKTKFWLYILFMLTGIFMVIWGFRRWQLREQSIRDAILKLDEEIKRKESAEMMNETN